MRPLYLAAIALLLLVALPTPLVQQAMASDTPTAADVFAGDSYLRATSATGGIRHWRLGLVDDATTANGLHRAGWDHDPGAQYTFTWRVWVTGTAPPAAIDGDGSDLCKAEIRSEATVVVTLFTGTTCPATGATYTWTPTTAGTFRIYVNAVQTNELIDNFNVATGSGGVIDYGALRVGLAVGSMAHGGYPTGTTHAYTVAGETVGLTVGHTAVAAGQPTSNVVLKALDASNAAVKSSTVALTGTSTATTFTIDDAWPASSCSCGFEVQVTATIAFTGTQWTHIASVTAPGALVSEFVGRHTAAYTVDARVTATHLMQNDNTFSTPPMTENDPDDSRYGTDLAYVATRFTNARSEGLAGASFAFTSTLRDSGLIAPLDARSQGTGLAIGTQGGEAGWSGLRIFNDGAPQGTWTKTIDITAPSAMDNDAHLIAATKTYSVTIPAGEGGEGMGDPLKVFVSPLQAAPGDDVLFSASEAFLDGTARTMNAADTKVYLYDPSGDLVVNGAATAEIHDGIYHYTHTLAGDAELGAWIVVIETTDPTTMDPVTTSNTFLVTEAGPDIAASLQDHRDKSLELDMHDPTTDFNGLGLDGFLIVAAWFIAFFVMLYLNKVFAAFSAFLGLFDAVTNILPGSWMFYTLIFILALWIEAIAGDGIYAKWLGWKEKRKTGRDAP